jgi:hypothetical protein
MHPSHSLLLIPLVPALRPIPNAEPMLAVRYERLQSDTGQLRRTSTSPPRTSTSCAGVSEAPYLRPCSHLSSGQRSASLVSRYPVWESPSSPLLDVELEASSAGCRRSCHCLSHCVTWTASGSDLGRLGVCLEKFGQTVVPREGAILVAVPFLFGRSLMLTSSGPAGYVCWAYACLVCVCQVFVCRVCVCWSCSLG